MEDLKIAVDGFKETLTKNLKLEKPSHFAVMLWLIRVFAIANAHLQKAATLEKKGEIFTFMKTLTPFLNENKQEVEQKLRDNTVEHPTEFKKVINSFEEQKKVFAKYLRDAKREKEKKNRTKV